MSKRIPVYKKKEIVAFAEVDDEDYEFLSSLKWLLAESGQVYTSVTMGRLLLRPESGNCCDHEDRNKLNNQKENC